jgi:chromosome partitioning protein
MRKIVVALSKGGVGKTTTAVNLAYALARMGNRVLLVDADTQGQAGNLLLPTPALPHRGLADVLLNHCSPQEAMVEARPGLYLLAGGIALNVAKREIEGRSFGQEHALREALQPLDGTADYVILDTSPAWDSLASNAMFYAQEILAPISLEWMSLDRLAAFVSRIQAVQKYHPALRLRYLLPTFLDGRVRKSAELMDVLRERYADVLCQPIHYSVRVSESPAFHQTIFEYGPTCPAAKDYAKLAERIANDARP